MGQLNSILVSRDLGKYSRGSIITLGSRFSVATAPGGQVGSNSTCPNSSVPAGVSVPHRQAPIPSTNDRDLTFVSPTLSANIQWSVVPDEYGSLLSQFPLQLSLLRRSCSDSFNMSLYDENILLLSIFQVSTMLIIIRLLQLFTMNPLPSSSSSQLSESRPGADRIHYAFLKHPVGCSLRILLKL